MLIIRKLIDWLRHVVPSDASKRAAEWNRYKALSEAEQNYSTKFCWQSEEEAAKVRESYPLCPKCRSNEHVYEVVYGLLANPVADWERKYRIFRGCIVSSAERWTCESCKEDFFGHHAQQPGTINK